ncbi:MAG: ABC transporter ATP-binding protein/permease [Oscillospiraceae bacterium]|nr:ABC transporter ATP-binding protein/permease [Oscillospiraceae bacterium]
MVLEVYVDLLQPRLMARIVDEGILGLNNGGVSDLHIVTGVGLKMLLIVLCGGLCGILSGVCTNLCSQNFGNDVRKSAFRKIMSFSFSQTDRFSVGSLITRTTGDVTQVQNMVSQMIRGCVRCAMFFVAGSIALISLAADFGTVIVIALPLILLEIAFVLWKTNPLFRLLQSRLDRMNTVIQENVAGARVVKAFIQEDREIRRFAQSNDELVDTQFRVLILMSYMRPVMNIVLNLATVAIIYIGSLRVQAGAAAPGTVMAAVTYLSQILNGMMMLAMIFQTVTRGLTSSQRLREILTTESPIQDGTGAAVSAGGSVTFKNVCFSYADHGADVLHNINLSVRAGETLAVIGETGCGKSTLVNLIPRFYDAGSGTVEVDGTDVRDYPLSVLRDKIAVVLQKSELFSTTIKENIRIGNPDATDAEIRKAAATAQADGFISEQPQQYDTPVAESGMSLSGGQRQRIAISRALVKKAEILILDDSTSALDFRTEAALQKALREKFRDMTKIIIAQRISSVRNADRIAVMENGTVAACDTHDNLMQTCKIYQDIYASQLRKEDA